MPSPALPWEVIERIIGHSWHDYPTIRNFSLTCRELRPRSLCLLVAEAVLHSRDKIFNFCDFLRAKPYLKPLVRSILVDPNNFAPVPLLRLLPNLSEIRFTFDNDNGDFIHTVLNQSVLTSCRLLSTRIQTLSLAYLSFAASLQFLQILSAFTNIVHLNCLDVLFDAEGDGPSPNHVFTQRLSQRLRLLTVSIPAFCVDTVIKVDVYISSS